MACTVLHMVNGKEVMARHIEEEDLEGQRRAKVSQSEFPNLTLPQAFRISEAIWDNFAGKGAAPHLIAMALELSPTSGGWRNLCGSSIAYGLTEGGYNAAEIILTELGRRIVAPTEEGDDLRARIEAVLKPRIQREFFAKYNRAKLPRDDIARNVLAQMGLPKERTDAALEILKANGEHTGIIQQTKTGPFIALDSIRPSAAKNPAEVDQADAGTASSTGTHAEATSDTQPRTSAAPGALTTADSGRVFITHGRNSKILEQIKRAVVLGGFQPVISVQQETSAKPVPDKVMDDMRLCRAAVIHVGAEGVLTDSNGKGHSQINPNVLIEIGAAMALYRGRFILVVEDGLDLPSNLQGLYRCYYKGEGLDWDAGMKILEALRGLKVNGPE